MGTNNTWVETNTRQDAPSGCRDLSLGRSVTRKGRPREQLSRRANIAARQHALS